MDDLERLGKRFVELARRAADGAYYVFTDFLGLAEQSTFAEAMKAAPRVKFSAFGGADGAERVMIRFGDPDEIGYEEPYPIACLHAVPRDEKFADKLTHRDFLGGLMSLGIEREKLGDIVLRDNTAYIFCHADLADFLADGLSRVKHTDLRVSAVDLSAGTPFGDGPLFRTEEVRIQAASERIDGVIAKVFRLSRDDALGLFRKKLVFLSGKECENNAKDLRPGDVVSVRGYGRFIYRGYLSDTKKGKLNLLVEQYV